MCRVRDRPRISKRLPREGLLENPLTEIAREEKAVRSIRPDRGEKTQLRHAGTLCFVDHDKLDGRMCAVRCHAQ